METDFEALLGIPSPYYMQEEQLSQVFEFGGIEQATSQLYLASTDIDQCEESVDITAYDPETDFVIEPWVSEGTAGSSLIVGADIDAAVGDTITILGYTGQVTGKLDATGMSMDHTVYADYDTAREIMAASLAAGIMDFGSFDPQTYSSCVLIKTSFGTLVEEVVNDINLHLRNSAVIQADNAMSDVADSFSGAADIAWIITVILWVLVLIVLTVAFFVDVMERKKEFAVLRVVGASRQKLRFSVMGAAAACAVPGIVLGIVLSLVLSTPYAALLKSRLDLPGLMPGVSSVIRLALTAALFAAVAALAAALLAAGYAARIDPGLVLRDDDA